MDLAPEATWPRDQLDADYTARNACSEAEFHATIGRYADLSATARRMPGTRTGLAFDPHSAETLDLFGTAPGALRPCFVFLHGGYWRALSKAHSAFMAPMLAARGIACAVPDYTLAPKVGITEIVRQCRAALAHLWHNAAELGIDRGRIVVGGSSAGGHLTGTLMQPGWQQAAGLPPQPLRGAMPVSGLFDLAPVAASHVQDWMQFHPDEIAGLSPLRHPPAHPLPCAVALAQGETAGFLRQSQAYADLLGVPLQVVGGRHHFDVVLDWTDPGSALSRALLGLF